MLGILVSIVASIAALVCWALGLLGLPGNWGIVLIAGLLAWLCPEEWPSHLAWWVVGCLAAWALLGELLEFFAGSAGVGKSGGSRRAMVLALIGSMVGALVGLFVGLPIPILGGLVGSVIFSGIGAAVGAVLGQLWLGKKWHETADVGWAAFQGRLVGTLGKSICGGLMVLQLIFGLIF